MIYLFLLFSIIFQVIFNLFLFYSIINLPNVNFVLVFFSIIFLAFFLLFYEKIQNIKIKSIFLIIQFLFSVLFNYILLIFLILIAIVMFKDVKEGINIFNTILFLIFLFLPFVYQPIQNIIAEKVIDFLEPKIKEIVLNQIKTQISIDIEYTINVAIFGFNFAVNNLEVKDYDKIENIKNLLVDAIKNQSIDFEKIYINIFYEKAILNLKEILKQNKLLISLVVLVFLYFIFYIYLFFVSVFYEIFKKISFKVL
ncbi:MAG: hypothetical protein QXQ91_02780 [Nanopusillaceae archaeon]